MTRRDVRVVAQREDDPQALLVRGALDDRQHLLLEVVEQLARSGCLTSTCASCCMNCASRCSSSSSALICCSTARRQHGLLRLDLVCSARIPLVLGAERSPSACRSGPSSLLALLAELRFGDDDLHVDEADLRVGRKRQRRRGRLRRARRRAVPAAVPAAWLRLRRGWRRLRRRAASGRRGGGVVCGIGASPRPPEGHSARHGNRHTSHGGSCTFVSEQDRSPRQPPSIGRRTLRADGGSPAASEPESIRAHCGRVVRQIVGTRPAFARPAISRSTHASIVRRQLCLAVLSLAAVRRCTPPYTPTTVRRPPRRSRATCAGNVRHRRSRFTVTGVGRRDAPR